MPTSSLLYPPQLDPSHGSSIGYTKTYLNKINDWESAAFEEAKKTQQMNPQITKVAGMINYLQGEFWDRRRPRYLSTFSDNRMENARYATLAMLTDIRPTIDVHSLVDAFKGQAEIAQNIIHHEWYQQSLDLSLINVVDAAMLFGNAFWKVDAMTPGNMKFSPCGPDVVMPIQPGFGIQESSAVLYRTYKTIGYFQRKWPERSADLQSEAVMPDEHQGSTIFAKPPGISDSTWNALSPQMKYKMGLRVGGKLESPSNNSYPVIELKEYWVDDHSINESTEEVIVKDPYLALDQHNYWYRVPPMRRLYPRKRLLVFAGNRLMYDGPSPYWHGKYPFSMLRLNPTIWSFWGLSKYQNLIPLNKAINEIGAGTMDMIKRALNPQMLAKENSIVKDAFERFFPNMPGGKLKMTNMSDVQRDVRYMDPPQLPAYVFQFFQAVSGEFDRLAGAVDVGKLSNKKQVPGGESIEQMRDAANPAIRLEGRYIEDFLRDTGMLAISNVFQFYTAKRRLRILGGNGLTWQDFDYDPGNMVPDAERREEHWMNFSMEIAPGSLLGTNKTQEKTAAMTLFKLGAISRAALLRKLDLGAEATQIEQEIKKEHAEGTSPHQGSGRTPRQNREQRNGSPM